SALGFAHIGVLKALEEHEIYVDYISGTSIGAIIGTLYAFGIPLNEIESEVRKLTLGKIMKFKPSALGIISDTTLKNILKKYIDKYDLADAVIPMAIVTTDIETGEKIVFRKGDALKAVMASSCLPGLFPPVEIDERLLVDGGIVENVPISPLKDMGAEMVIGVNLLKYRKYQKPRNAVEVIANAFGMVNHEISIIDDHYGVDFLIEPNLSDFYMNDVNKWKDIVELGYAKTLEFVSAINKKQNKTQKDDFWSNIKKAFKEE
ncbi:MAG: patatin-like phospholipase family protein, partial [Candidatus Staskawiczbacteria bacterium]